MCIVRYCFILNWVTDQPSRYFHITNNKSKDIFLKKIATELKPPDSTQYTYWLQHIKS